MGALTLLLVLTQLGAGDCGAGPDQEAREREGSATAAAMTLAAKQWLALLDEPERGRAALPFGHPARKRWQATPGQRVGLAWGDMSLAQRVAAEQLLRTGLSEAGVQKFHGVVFLEGILRRQAGAQGRVRSSWRDPGLYWLAVFGAPSLAGTWSWRLEGHHYSRHFTCVGGRVSCSPAFHGANPARVAGGPRSGERVLALEEDLARDLRRGLDPERLSRAVLPTAPRDFLPGSPRSFSELPPRGLRAADMTEVQRQALWRIISLYTSVLHDDLARQTIERARATRPGELCFAWMGSPQVGRSHGYRIQGPTLLIEYWYGGNHIHTVWRDPLDEFGAALLAKR